MVSDKQKESNRRSYLRSVEKRNYAPNFRFNRGRWGAKNRELSWTINLLEYTFLLSLGCIYCHKSVKRETGTALDRIDNRHGYELDNVYPCCGRCNKVRGSILSVEEMMYVGYCLNKFHGVNS
jgi:hypothetical protein